MERETGIEPATSSLGNSISIENKKLMRRRRRTLSTQVRENIDRTFPRVRNRSNRSNNKLPHYCFGIAPRNASRNGWTSAKALRHTSICQLKEIRCYYEPYLAQSNALLFTEVLHKARSTLLQAL